jgi:hypothetical protein
MVNLFLGKSWIPHFTRLININRRTLIKKIILVRVLIFDVKIQLVVLTFEIKILNCFFLISFALKFFETIILLI